MRFAKLWRKTRPFTKTVPRNSGGKGATGGMAYNNRHQTRQRNMRLPTSLVCILIVLSTAHVVLGDSGWGRHIENTRKWIYTAINATYQVEGGTYTLCRAGGLSDCVVYEADPSAIGATFAAADFGSPPMFYPLTNCLPPVLDIESGAEVETVGQVGEFELRRRSVVFTPLFTDGVCHVDPVAQAAIASIITAPLSQTVAIGEITAVYGYSLGYNRAGIPTFHSGVDTRTRTLYDENGNFIAGIYTPFPLTPFIVRSGAVFGATTCSLPDNPYQALLEYAAGAPAETKDCGLVLWGGLHTIPEALPVEHPTRLAVYCGEGDCPKLDKGQMLAPCKVDDGSGWGTDQPHCHYMLVVFPEDEGRHLVNDWLSRKPYYMWSYTTSALALGELWDVLYKRTLDPLMVMYPICWEASTPEGFANCWAQHPLPMHLAYSSDLYSPTADWTNDGIGDYAVGQPALEGVREVRGGNCAILDKPIAGHICATAKLHGERGAGIAYQYLAAQRAFALIQSLRRNAR